jgi:hypothetical protein
MRNLLRCRKRRVDSPDRAFLAETDYSTSVPIPNFDTNLVLPPHLGDPRVPAQLSPYPCSSLELCQRFATSAERRQILDGLLRFRELLSQAGFATGFQWIDGSFLENIEAREARPPVDLDIITFVLPVDAAFVAGAVAAHPVLIDHDATKMQYSLDHYWVNLAYNPISTVELTRYWIGLFSHRRDGIWKGILRLELNTAAIDSAARDFLRNLP